MKSKIDIISITVGMLAAVCFCVPAYAAKAPSQEIQEILVKGTISTFNDANIVDNYHVLHDKMAKQFRDKFTEEKLSEIFKEFRDGGVDLSQIIIMKVNYTAPASVDEDDVLSLSGYFDTSPNKTYFGIQFVMSDGVWKPLGIKIRLKD